MLIVKMPQAASSCLLLVERAERSTFMMSKGVKTTALICSLVSLERPYELICCYCQEL